MTTLMQTVLPWRGRSCTARVLHRGSREWGDYEGRIDFSPLFRMRFQQLGQVVFARGVCAHSECEARRLIAEKNKKKKIIPLVSCRAILRIRPTIGSRSSLTGRGAERLPSMPSATEPGHQPPASDARRRPHQKLQTFIGDGPSPCPAAGDPLPAAIFGTVIHRGRIRRIARQRYQWESAINRGPHIPNGADPRATLPAPSCLERIEKGEIDPSFVITHRAEPSMKDPKLYKTFRAKKDGLHQGWS